jgi:AraC-like DNA-binding protein
MKRTRQIHEGWQKADLVRSSDDGLDRPVSVLCRTLLARSVVPEHSHPWGQLIYSYTGVLEVTTPNGRYLLPSDCAVWVPPGIVHEVSTQLGAEISSLYISAEESMAFAKECCVLHVKSLLRELIIATLELEDDCDWCGADGRLFRTLLDQIAVADIAPLYLPLPRDNRLLKICRHLQHSPDDNRTIEQWSDLVGASIRTLQRMFRKETKLSFQEWRHQLRVQIAQQRLAQGDANITQVASELGYDSSSAFIAMFKQYFDVSPGEFMKSIGRIKG